MVTWRTYRGIIYSIEYFRRVFETLRAKHGKCPKCNGVLVIRNGKYGKFLGCQNYPYCKYTRDLTLSKK